MTGTIAPLKPKVFAIYTLSKTFAISALSDP